MNHLPMAISPLVAYPNAGFLVATSSSPSRPFNVVTERASVQVKDLHLRVELVELLFLKLAASVNASF